MPAANAPTALTTAAPGMAPAVPRRVIPPLVPAGTGRPTRSNRGRRRLQRPDRSGPGVRAGRSQAPGNHPECEGHVAAGEHRAQCRKAAVRQHLPGVPALALARRRRQPPVVRLIRPSALLRMKNAPRTAAPGHPGSREYRNTDQGRRQGARRRSGPSPPIPPPKAATATSTEIRGSGFMGPMSPPAGAPAQAPLERGGGRRLLCDRHHMTARSTVPALIPLSLLQALRNLDAPLDDGLEELASEMVAKRFGLSETVAAQIERYEEAGGAGRRGAAGRGARRDPPGRAAGRCPARLCRCRPSGGAPCRQGGRARRPHVDQGGAGRHEPADGIPDRGARGVPHARCRAARRRESRGGACRRFAHDRGHARRRGLRLHRRRCSPNCCASSREWKGR